MRSLLYGLFLVMVICLCLRYTQSTPIFGKEYVHIKVHVPVEARHHGPAAVTHSKIVHHHYHKRRRPAHKFHGTKPHADDILEALIVSTASKPLPHHDDAPFLVHDEHYDTLDAYTPHHDHHSFTDHEAASLEDVRYRTVSDQDDIDIGHQSYYKPQQHAEILRLVHSKKPSNNYAPVISYEDDSNLETETIKFHDIPKPLYEPEISEELESTISHFRPSPHETSTPCFTPHLSTAEDFHYRQTPTHKDEFLEIGTIYQPDVLKNPAQDFKSHNHKEPINIEYLPKTSTGSGHHSQADYTPDYVGQISQVAEYLSVDGKEEVISHKHPDYEGYDELSSHDEPTSQEGSKTVTVDGSIIDWPSGDSGHHDSETYAGIDSYSATHVQGVGSGGYHYRLPNSRKKK